MLDPRWTGRVLVRDPMPSGTMRMIFEMIIYRGLQETGDTAAGYGWLRRLDAQTKEYVLNPAILYQKLARQEGLVTLWNLPDVLRVQAQGFPLDYIVPASGAPVSVDAIAVVKGAGSRELAESFIEFVGSVEGQLLAVRNSYRNPTRSDLPVDSLPEWLVRVNQEVPIKNLERILRLDEALDIVYRTGDSILLTECVCRRLQEDPCRPLEVCMVVGEPFASFVARQQGENCRWITQEEAVEVLEKTEKLGWPHIIFNRDVVGDNFYAICHCCKCCCGGIEAMVKYGIPALAPSGYIATVNAEGCTACAICQEACPFGGVEVDEVATVNWEMCMGCGVCVGRCPNKAISLERDERKGVPMDVRLM